MTTETLNVLLMRMKQFNVAFLCTDKFKAYSILPKENNIVGKLYTQRSERENLTLRNRLKRFNRKTLGYSKSADMHYKGHAYQHVDIGVKYIFFVEIIYSNYRRKVQIL